ncbi:MAG: PIN domain-containing protein [Acidobacteria bacterium]|nr:PIN domain-containing protein [Acidobacteriota bacterium]MCG3193947.1 tRNA(fMet)-specific endonuclease VapC [Thermoanaerobaculia bacterium]
MSAGYLLDTNICVYAMNGLRKEASRRTRAEARVCERLQQEESPVFTSEVTVGELVLWADRSEQPVKNRQRIEAFLEAVPPLAVSRRVWVLFGKTKARLVRKGVAVSDLDLVIACLAHAEGLVLVSNDGALENLPDSFRLENWAGPDR